jgi:hypothetical protein
MPTTISVTALDFWFILLSAAPAWLGSSDPKIRHASHREVGRLIKILVLAHGGRQVEANFPTGRPPGEFPMSSGRYELPASSMTSLLSAIERLADRIRGKV